MQRSLPIWQIHSAIVSRLQTGNRLVLVAPTGSGKTTQVPQMLLDAGLARTRKIVVLQPRRVAARTVAARVAWERNTRLGREVGYQIRFDDQTSLGTRICFVTEGILLRWLQEDRALPDVGIILFDEFHERNLLSDVALALVKEIQQNQRPDLKMVVMSATLEAEPVAEYLSYPQAGAGGSRDQEPGILTETEGRARSEAGSANASGATLFCPILLSEGQAFPVQVQYLDQRDERPVEEQAAEVVSRIIHSGAAGDILVFMPGMGEINATIQHCRALRTGERLAVIPLHGELEPEQQDLAFAPHEFRKVVVSTNVAETSVTIDGIRHVVDSGLARIARYDAERGISTLLIEEISRASADQRKGRAGRTAAGTCYRLWTESSHLNRPERNTPEIQRSDLAEVVLLLHSMGIKKAVDFHWLDEPDSVAVERAENLLRILGALEPRGTPSPEGSKTRTGRESELASPHPAMGSSDLTPVGRHMLRLPMHPRYSRMLVEATRLDCVPAAGLCAALVSGRDLLQRLRREDKHIAEGRERFEASRNSDFFTLLQAYEFAKKSSFDIDQCRRYGINAHVARQVEQTCDQVLQLARQQRLSTSSDSARVGENSRGEEALRTDHRPMIRPIVPAGESEDPLLRCIMVGFIDQLCKRRDQGTLECDLTEGRHGTLMRESVISSNPGASLFVAATIREVPSRGAESLTLLGLASLVKQEWIAETFPQHLSVRVEHIFDRTHKRVAAVKRVRFGDLVIHSEHQRDVEAIAAGRCLAEAYGNGWFELPLFNHEIKQFVARVNLVTAALPELEFPRFDKTAIMDCLARAFAGITLAKEAQRVHLKQEFMKHLVLEQIPWLDELAPPAFSWPDGRRIKLLYQEACRDEDGKPLAPEAQVKLHECFQLKDHPHICEGKLPVKLWLCAPDGKRLDSTLNWLTFKAHLYPKLKATLQKKYPGVAWI